MNTYLAADGAQIRYKMILPQFIVRINFDKFAWKSARIGCGCAPNAPWKMKKERREAKKKTVFRDKFSIRSVNYEERNKTSNNLWLHALKAENWS